MRFRYGSKSVGRTIQFSSRRLSGEAGFEKGKLVETRELSLNESDSRRLDNLIVTMNVFQMKVTDDTIEADGDEWVFEAVSGENYHVIRRCCLATDTKARELGSFVELCQFLMSNSGLSQWPNQHGYELLPGK